MADTTQQMAAAEEKKEDAVPQQAKAHPGKHSSLQPG